MIITRLKGGIGNQMFQYATGYAVACEKKQPLALDIRSGFIRDKVFRRTFSLNRLKIDSFKKASGFSRLLFVLTNKFPVLRTFFKKTELPFIVQNAHNDQLFGTYLGNHIWLDGYWQSYCNFKQYERAIFDQFSANLTSAGELTTLLNIDFENSIALCMRFFEEVPGNLADDMATNLLFYKKAMASFSNRPDATFVIFSSDSKRVESFLQSLDMLPGRYRLLTADLGFSDEIQTLSLISHFKNIIISNSSFYWWGAWLSSKRGHTATIVAPANKGLAYYYPEEWTIL